MPEPIYRSVCCNAPAIPETWDSTAGIGCCSRCHEWVEFFEVKLDEDTIEEIIQEETDL